MGTRIARLWTTLCARSDDGRAQSLGSRLHVLRERERAFARGPGAHKSSSQGGCLSRERSHESRQHRYPRMTGARRACMFLGAGRGAGQGFKTSVFIVREVHVRGPGARLKARRHPWTALFERADPGVRIDLRWHRMELPGRTSRGRPACTLLWRLQAPGPVLPWEARFR